MICAAPSASIASGVLKENGALALWFRGVFHRTSPVFASSAATKGSRPPSQLKTSSWFPAPPTSAGEPPLPWTGGYFRDVCRQSTLPERSSATVPMWPKCTYRRSAVTTGVGLAAEFFSCIGRARDGAGLSSSTSHRLFPPAASKHSARSDTAPPPSATAVVRYTRPPASTGDDHPRPGTGVFHATFF